MLGNQGLSLCKTSLDSGFLGDRGTRVAWIEEETFSLCLQGPHPACSGLPSTETNTLVLDSDTPGESTGKAPQAAFWASDGEPGLESSVVAAVIVDTLGGSLQMLTTPEATLARRLEAGARRCK